jgi:hypothetical protein
MKHLLQAALLATLATTSFAVAAAPGRPASPGAEVRVADAMVQTAAARKKTHTRIKRTRIHKHTVTRHTQTHTQSTAGGSDAK